MKELYSNADDCLKLSRLLKSKLKEKIEFMGSTYLEVVTGKYHSLPYNKYNNFIDYRNDEVEFCYTFLENGFLTITVNDTAYKKFTIGHKLAVLSDLYEVISEVYGMPDVFYTLKEDDENSLNLEWDFLQKEEAIYAFKNGSRFEDAFVEDLIIIGEEEEKTSAYRLKKRTKEMIAKTVGLPFEMLYLVDENVDDFVLYKKGEKMNYPKNAKINGYSIMSFEDDKKLIKK